MSVPLKHRFQTVLWRPTPKSHAFTRLIEASDRWSRLVSWSSATSRNNVAPASRQLRSQIIDAANQLLSLTPNITQDSIEAFSDPSGRLTEMFESYSHLLEHRKLKASHLHDILFLSSRAVNKYQLKQSMLRKHKVFFSSLLAKLHNRLLKLNSRQMAIVIWSLGELAPDLSSLGLLKEGLSVSRLLSDTVRWCAQRMDNFNEKEVTRILVSYANLECSYTSFLVPSLTEFCKKKKSTFKPEDLCTLAWALGRLKLTEAREILEILTFTIKQRVSAITPLGLSRYIWASGQLKAKLPASMLQPIMRKLEYNLRSLSPSDVANVLQGLSQISYQPRFEFLETVEVYCTDQISMFRPSEVTCILKALAIFSYAPETLLKVSKAYILDYYKNFDFSLLCDIVWALSILDALDVSFLELACGEARDLNKGPFWTESGEKSVDPKIRDEDLQKIFQGALHLKIFKKQKLSEMFLDGFYEICQSAWTTHYLFISINPLALQILECFEYLGYNGECPFFETTSKLKLICIKTSKGGRIVLEIMEEDHCFVNNKQSLKGPQRWRHKLLKALGWPLFILFEDVWTSMDFQDQSSYLNDHILPLLL